MFPSPLAQPGTALGIVALTAVLPQEPGNTQERLKHWRAPSACCCPVAVGSCTLLGGVGSAGLQYLVQEHVPHSLHRGRCGNAHQKGKTAPECNSKTAPSPAITFSQLSEPSLPEYTICSTSQPWDRLHCRQHMLKAAWKSEALTQRPQKTPPWHISTLGLSARAEPRASMDTPPSAARAQMF